MLIAFLLVGAAIGAPARYLVDGAVQDRVAATFPWGTFVVNVSGSLVLGIVTGLTLSHGLGDVPRAAVGAGFCGAFTTFSTYSYETVRLLETREIRSAAAYASLSLAAGLLVAGLGLAVTASL